MASYTKKLKLYEVNYGLIAHPGLRDHYVPSESIEVIDEKGEIIHTKLHSTRSRIDGLTLWHYKHNTQINDTVIITIADDRKLHLTLNRSEQSQKRIEDLKSRIREDQFQTLDDLVSAKVTIESLFRDLKELDVLMEKVKPKRVQHVVSNTIRNDTKIVHILKEIAGYRCQFPNCSSRIRKRDGTIYVEVAHVRPISEAGKSVLGNLVVLCPNHHKEFDLGELKITYQSLERLIGILNGIAFSIELIHM